jgi:aminopeptidase N
MTDINRLERGLPGKTAFQAYGRSVLAPVLQRIGWDLAPHENEDTAMLRSTLVAALGNLDDPALIAGAKRRFDLFLANPASLNVNLRDAVIGVVGRHADQATYDALRKLARESNNAHDRVRYYTAMASASDPSLIAQTLAIALTDELQPERASELIRVVAAGEHPELALEFTRKNFDALAVKRGPEFRYFFMSELMANFTEASYARQLVDFKPVHETTGGRLEALRAESRINESADFRAHQIPQIDDWVRNQGKS